MSGIGQHPDLTRVQIRWKLYGRIKSVIARDSGWVGTVLEIVFLKIVLLKIVLLEKQVQIPEILEPRLEVDVNSDAIRISV